MVEITDFVDMILSLYHSTFHEVVEEIVITVKWMICLSFTGIYRIIE